MPIKNGISISREEIEPYLNRDYWGFGNKILYDMVEQKHDHTDADIIHTKLWLIGRAYAAPIERNKAMYDRTEGDFYYVKAVPHMLKIGEKLDKRIAELNKHESIASLTELELMLDTHAFLVSEFKEITWEDKRSLASKYLHFHAPNMVYIYDGRAEKESCRYVRAGGPDYEHLKEAGSDKWDAGYIKFVSRMFELQKYIKKEFEKRLSPRALDSFLLQFKYYN